MIGFVIYELTRKQSGDGSRMKAMNELTDHMIK